MAKQTFTTGQVLTAAQMTSLQQTAMLGGDTTAKTASYVLVAADAGTTVAMNAAGSTTITVNTGLFAAGDTVFIQNRGAGACTVTQGTATVATAGSLVLPQNDAGILYFTSASAAIFYDFIQVGAASPLTTKGDVYGFSTVDARIPIGANNTVLTADSTQALGLKWAAPAASSSGLNLILTESFSSVSSLTRDSLFTTTYDNYRVVVEFVASQNSSFNFNLRSSGSNVSSANYQSQAANFNDTTISQFRTTNATFATIGNNFNTGRNLLVFDIASPFLSQHKTFVSNGFASTNSANINLSNGALLVTTSCTGIYFYPNNGTITGNVSYYGYGK